MAGNVLTKALFCAALLLAPRSTEAEEPVLIPRCGGAFDLCGFVEQHSEKLRIPYTFEDAGQFSEGLAAVRINGKYGYVDPDGILAIDPKFDLAGQFNKGLAEVFAGTKAGVVDVSGEYVLNPRFGRAIPLTFDTVLASETTETARPPSQFEVNRGLLESSIRNTLFGLHKVSHGWVSDRRYFVANFNAPSGDQIWASETPPRSGRYGLLRADGQWQVEPRYAKVSSLTNGLAIVRGVPGNGTEDALDGAVDETGKLVIPLKFEGLSYWIGEYGLARKYGEAPKLGLVTREGSLLAGRYFDDVQRHWDGRLPRVLEGGRWHSVKRGGTLVDDERDDHVRLSCPGGLEIFKKHGFISVHHPNLGSVVDTRIRAGWEALTSAYCDRPYTLLVGTGQIRFVTQDGRLLPSSGWFEKAYDFRNGIAVVSRNGKWGVIDESGEFTVPPIYDSLGSPLPSNIDLGMALKLGEQDLKTFRVNLAGREFLIDAWNRELKDTFRPSEKVLGTLLVCGETLERFEQNGLWGMKDENGEILIPPQYRALTCYRRGYAWGALVNKKRWCPIGPDGTQHATSACKEHIDVLRQTNTRLEEFSKDSHENHVLWLRARLEYASGKRLDPPRVFSNSTF